MSKLILHQILRKSIESPEVYCGKFSPSVCSIVSQISTRNKFKSSQSSFEDYPVRRMHYMNKNIAKNVENTVVPQKVKYTYYPRAYPLMLEEGEDDYNFNKIKLINQNSLKKGRNERIKKRSAQECLKIIYESSSSDLHPNSPSQRPFGTPHQFMYSKINRTIINSIKSDLDQNNRILLRNKYYCKAKDPIYSVEPTPHVQVYSYGYDSSYRNSQSKLYKRLSIQTPKNYGNSKNNF